MKAVSKWRAERKRDHNREALALRVKRREAYLLFTKSQIAERERDRLQTEYNLAVLEWNALAVSYAKRFLNRLQPGRWRVFSELQTTYADLNSKIKEK